MELLILSKLKWDLTAVTSYDYLDYLLEFLVEPNKNRKDPSRHPSLLRNSAMESIRQVSASCIAMSTILGLTLVQLVDHVLKVEKLDNNCHYDRSSTLLHLCNSVHLCYFSSICELTLSTLGM